MARKDISTLSLRPAQSQDLPSCAEIWGERCLTYTSIYPWRLRRSDVTQSERFARNERDLLKEFNDPAKTFIVATIRTAPAQQQIVGYTIYQDPADKHKRVVQNNDQTDDDRDPEVNHELAEQIRQEGVRVKVEYYGDDSWYLSHLFVHNGYQRLGIGAKLLQHALDSMSTGSADKGSTMALTSSPQGMGLYERYGFRDVYWFNPHWEDIDEEGKVVQRSTKWPLMIKVTPEKRL